MVVRVVIVTYNSSADIGRCLETLLTQDGARISVTVVDNASSDNTRDMIRVRYPSVRLISLDKNVGFARANNLALADENVSGYWLLLNPDTYFTQPDTIARLVKNFSLSPRIGVVGCKLIRPDGTVDHAAKRGIPTPWSALSYFLRLNRLFPRSRFFASYTAGHVRDDAGPVVVDCVNGAFMLLRPEPYRDIGMLDERFFMYGEDIDLCLRLSQSGWLTLYDPSISVVHLKGASSGGIGFGRSNNDEFIRSMVLFYRKHMEREYPFLVSLFVLLALRVLRLGSPRR